jgi:putative FmdB family regulatory protein
MLAYEYQCRQCGHHFEALQNITDAPVETCPQCDGAVERVISGGSGFVFKEQRPAASVNKAQVPCCGSQGGCANPKRCCEQ